MVKGRLKRESNPPPGERSGYTAQGDTTGNEDWENVSPINPLNTVDNKSIAELKKITTAVKGNSITVPEADYTEILTELASVKNELKEIKATQKEILTKLNSGVVSYKGNATDDKSVIAPNAKRGDEFIELDTKEIYFYTTEWEVF